VIDGTPRSLSPSKGRNAATFRRFDKLSGRMGGSPDGSRFGYPATRILVAAPLGPEDSQGVIDGTPRSLSLSKGRNGALCRLVPSREYHRRAAGAAGCDRTGSRLGMNYETHSLRR
jgi:hypothetical protein